MAREWRMQFDRDGSGVPQEMYLNFTVVPRRSADGVIVGLNLAGNDVTDKVRQFHGAQEQAAEAERRYTQTRDVLTTLQRELLPPGLPVLPGTRIAGSYLLADADTAAGGDWFDTTPLPDGRVALVVGDVVGHGVAASAAMGQLRAVLADRLADGAGIAEALGAVDRWACRTPTARAATVCVAVLDVGSETVAFSTPPCEVWCHSTA